MSSMCMPNASKLCIEPLSTGLATLEFDVPDLVDTGWSAKRLRTIPKAFRRIMGSFDDPYIFSLSHLVFR